MEGNAFCSRRLGLELQIQGLAKWSYHYMQCATHALVNMLGEDDCILTRVARRLLLHSNGQATVVHRPSADCQKSTTNNRLSYAPTIDNCRSLCMAVLKCANGVEGLCCRQLAQAGVFYPIGQPYGVSMDLCGITKVHTKNYLRCGEPTQVKMPQNSTAIIAIS